MSDEHIDTSEASEYAMEYPTMKLRFVNGILEQFFVTDHYVRHDFSKRTEEWRKVPSE